MKLFLHQTTTVSLKGPEMATKSAGELQRRETVLAAESGVMRGGVLMLPGRQSQVWCCVWTLCYMGDGCSPIGIQLYCTWHIIV
jgi:hypothetical protein